MTPTTLLFDLDETLLADKSSTEEALLVAADVASHEHGTEQMILAYAVLQHAERLWTTAPTYHYCQSIGISSWEGLWGQFTGADPGLQALAAWMPDYQQSVWSLALAEQDVHDDAYATRMKETFLALRRQTFILCPHVERVLALLGSRYRLGIVTNGAPDLQHAKITGMGLRPYFDTIVVSGEVGVGKPDARVFSRALDALGVTPAQAVMIGDNIVRDIGGAQRMGMRGIWVNPKGEQAVRHGVTPDHTITTLAELSAILE